MTKEQAIEEINKAFEPAFANYIITAITKGTTVSDKALEQDVTDTNIGKINSDCVSRAEVVEFLKIYAESFETFIIKQAFITASALVSNPDNVSPVTPTHGTCKDCKYWCQYDGLDTCRLILRTRHRDFYCADFEKRGSENDSN